MSVLVTDAGFAADDWTGEVLGFETFWSGQELPEEGLAVEFPNDRDPADLARALLMSLGVPVIAFGLFLWVWSVLASQIQTSLGAVPGPAQVVVQAKALLDDHIEADSAVAHAHRAALVHAKGGDFGGKRERECLWRIHVWRPFAECVALHCTGTRITRRERRFDLRERSQAFGDLPALAPLGHKSAGRLARS